MKVALYIRVSTEEQALEGYSISAQKQRLKAYCIAQDWTIAGLYVDEGISAKDMNRPELQRMIQDIENGEIQCVLVYRLDRLTRSVLDLYKLLETFEKHDCKFKSATEVYDTTTAIGRLFITLVAALAQWERENMGERIRMGYQEKTRQGKFASNNRPYGFNLEKDGTLTINEDEARIVKEIFDMYLQGMGTGLICKKLNQRGIKTRDNGNWNQKGLSYIIRNTVYNGTLRWNKDEKNPLYVEEAVPKIIPDEEFEMANKLINHKANVHPRVLSSDYIFSGILKCPVCKGSMYGYPVYYKAADGSKLTYKNYRCYAKKTGRCPGDGSLSEKLLEKLMRSILTDDNREILEKSVMAIQDELSEVDQKIDHSTEIASLEKELKKIEKRKKKWQYGWSEDMMTDDEFNSRMEEERELEKNILQQIASLSEEQEETEPIDVLSIIKGIQKNWDELTDMEKKTLLQLTVSTMIVRKEGRTNYILEELTFV